METRDTVFNSAHRAVDKIASADQLRRRSAWRKRRATEKCRAEIDGELPWLYISENPIT